MQHLTPQDRALSLLKVMGAEPETRAASGRYVRAKDSRTGVRLWATTQTRYRQDLAGVQFYGRGRAEGECLAALFERNGFIQRTPQAGQLTFAKPVSYADDGGIDAASVAQVRDQIERLVEGRKSTEALSTPSGFRAFMLASPLAEANLQDPIRSAHWRDGNL